MSTILPISYTEACADIKNVVRKRKENCNKKRCSIINDAIRDETNLGHVEFSIPVHQFTKDDFPTLEWLNKTYPGFHFIVNPFYCIKVLLNIEEDKEKETDENPLSPSYEPLSYECVCETLREISREKKQESLNELVTMVNTSIHKAVNDEKTEIDLPPLKFSRDYFHEWKDCQQWLQVYYPKFTFLWQYEKIHCVRTNQCIEVSDISMSFDVELDKQLNIEEETLIESTMTEDDYDLITRVLFENSERLASEIRNEETDYDPDESLKKMDLCVEAQGIIRRIWKARTIYNFCKDVINVKRK
jgi:hypothetical protein